MKTKLILLFSTSIILASCSGGSNNKESVQSATNTAQEVHEDNPDSIELNNGAKWQVDEKMMVHIRNMESDISTFSATDQKDYKSLAAKLEKNIDLLTSSCTMEGKAHDELHKWLLPFIDLVKELSNAKDEATAANQFLKIQSSFTTFNYYFH